MNFVAFERAARDHPRVAVARNRHLRSLLPRDARGAVDLDAVDAALDALAAGRSITPRRRPRGAVSFLLSALQEPHAAPPPRRVDTRPAPAAPVAPAPIEAPAALPEPPSVVLRFDDEPFDEPLSDEATEPPRMDIERLAEPAPRRSEPAPLTLESLPPPPSAFPEASVLPAVPLPIARAADLIEPSLPPPPRPAEAAEFDEAEVRLSLAPLEPLTALEPEPVAPGPSVRPLPRTEAPSSAHLHALAEERGSQRPSGLPEALELDLAELGPSDVPPVMPRIPPQPAPSPRWAEVIAEEDIEPIDDLEVMELEDVRVAREPSRPSPPPPAPPRKLSRPVGVPPTPPPGLRKMR